MLKIGATIIVGALLSSSCNPKDQQNNGGSGTALPPDPNIPPTTNPDNPPDPDPNPPSTIKDKTPFPPLATKVPALNNSSGWQKIESTKNADIPSEMPTPAKVFFSARKTIDGRDRTISVAFGDLRLEPDAIVNAANTDLEGGSGIDGLIHEAAKVNAKDLLKDEAIAYKKHHKITAFPTGSAMVMNPYGLAPRVKMVVFTAGPSLSPSQINSTPEQDLELYSAVYNSLLKASEYGAKSLSMPTISTGIFRFPLPRAAELYFGAILQFFADHPKSTLEQVRIVDIAQNKIQGLGAKFRALWP